MFKKYCHAFVVLACAGMITTNLSAQEKDKKLSASATSPTKTVTLRQMVEPSFRVEPVVHRLKARRGEVLPIEFLVESTGKEMDIELRPVLLTQSETGLILHDETLPPPDSLKLSTPAEFNISVGKPQQVTGELTVPMTRTNFHSFGVLVRDKGQRTEFQNPDPTTKTAAGVRFVTQYILRCDIEIMNPPAENAGKLEIEKGFIATVDGQPWARAFLVNPTESALECQVRGSITNVAGSQRGKQLNLGLPSRAEMIEPDKYLVRVLPKSRVRVETLLTNPLFSGSHRFEVSVTSGRRELISEVFPISTAVGDFPAQDAVTGRIGEAVSIAPGRVHLSQMKGGKHSVSLTFTNGSEETQEIQFDSASLEGGPLPGLTMPSRKLKLAPGKSQSTIAMLRSQKDVKKPLYGFVNVTATSEAGVETKSSLPVILQYGAFEKSQVQFSEITMQTQNDQPRFVVTAKNEGAGFVPVNGRLIIGDEEGRAMQITAGFGRWLHPGESYDLVFTPTSEIPNGNYQLTTTFTTHDGDEPITSSLPIRIGPNEAEDATAKDETNKEKPAEEKPVDEKP